MKDVITIINFGMGNIGSLVNMFNRIGAKTEVTSKMEVIAKAKKIILPGVGKFDTAIERIDELGIRNLLLKKALIEEIPFLGICLGMQLLLDSSEEGSSMGLGIIPGKAIRFPRNNSLKVPHMGWNTVSIKSHNKLTYNLSENLQYYFVHSYYVKVNNVAHSFMTSNYHLNFDSGIVHRNIFGLQFHAEKSHKYGIEILKNFWEL